MEGRENASYTSRNHCVLCGGDKLTATVELPRFPLTGIFVEKSTTKSYPTFDQALLSCPTCGHAQLKNAVSPTYLYHDTYSHRTSPSPIAKAGNDFFFSFLKNIIGPRKFDTVLEVGCNDHYLLQKLEGICANRIGIDPILAGQEDQSPHGIRSIGKFVEDVNWSSECGRPDLVLSVHTFEHVLEPRKIFEPLFECAADGALFVIEVPGFDSLMRVNRFDQVFHQHVNYYSLASFAYLIAELGGTYLTHTFNYNYWNGTMLVAFEKKPSRTPTSFNKITAPSIKESFQRFQRTLSETRAHIDYLRGLGTPIYGFGAAQMVPCLAYHLQSDLSDFECIYDDNEQKTGMTYPGFKTEIWSTSDLSPIKEGAVMVTALDSARKIIPRLVNENARYIIQPLPLL